VLITMPSLDGYHRDVKLIARALLSTGHEVICTGMRRAPERVPSAIPATIPADKPIVGLSFLPGPRPPVSAAETGGYAVGTGDHSESIRAHIVFTPGAEIGTVVETLDRFGIAIGEGPERSC
jgi:hypothetical protein